MSPPSGFIPPEGHSHFTSAEALVEQTIARVGRKVVLGLPLALGKANHLANAFYRRAKDDPGIELTIFTALSLEVPKAPNALAARLLDPIAQRLYDGYPELDYATDRQKGALPANVTVKEFFLPPGTLLKNENAQRNYVSANYTHAGREAMAAGLNVLAQMVAREPGGKRYSLSCNPDLSLDLAPALRRKAAEGTPTAVLGEINEALPFLGRDAAVERDFFDALYDGGSYTLFPAPAPSVNIADHALGLQAASLVRDGGTLQIGIGALADAVSHAIILRHVHNAAFREGAEALRRATGGALIEEIGGLEPFEQGLYGCSEMVTDGMLVLLEKGILRRGVHMDLETEKKALEDPGSVEAAGICLHGGFYLGPAAMYERLRALSPELREKIAMTRVTFINDLFGEEDLARVQRREARFFNTAMKVNGRGAAISDALEDGRVVSGVGGQYNFAAMAQALEDGRSIILLRATRTSDGKARSNIVWTGGEVTVPRHLRDIVVTEYGIADLRGQSDREVAIRLARICDSRFQGEFLAAAKAAGKVEDGFELAGEFRNNTPEALEQALEATRRAGHLPLYPLGTDLTEEEQKLKQALEWLKDRTATKTDRAGTVARAMRYWKPPKRALRFLKRMQLARPSGPGEKIEQMLVTLALEETRRD